MKNLSESTTKARELEPQNQTNKALMAITFNILKSEHWASNSEIQIEIIGLFLYWVLHLSFTFRQPKEVSANKRGTLMIHTTWMLATTSSFEIDGLEICGVNTFCSWQKRRGIFSGHCIYWKIIWLLIVVWIEIRLINERWWKTE